MQEKDVNEFLSLPTAEKKTSDLRIEIPGLHTLTELADSKCSKCSGRGCHGKLVEPDETETWIVCSCVPWPIDTKAIIKPKAETEEVSGSFPADEITPENFEGFVKCRKKPIVVQALQMNFQEGFKVTTKEGVLTGKPGDYLMIGVRGEKYPIDKEIFEETYDIVDEAKEDLDKEGEEE